MPAAEIRPFSQNNETVKNSFYQLQSCSIRSFHQILLSNLQHKQQFRTSSVKTSIKTGAKLLEQFLKHTACLCMKALFPKRILFCTVLPAAVLDNVQRYKEYKVETTDSQ